jgi:transposase
MSGIRRKFDAEFKKNAVKLSYASPKPVKQIADDLGISDGMLYRWRSRYTADGEETVFAVQEEELKKLRIENAELKIERDMLKKAAAYFAKLQK